MRGALEVAENRITAKKIRQISQYCQKIQKILEFHSEPIKLIDSLTQGQKRGKKRAVGPWKQ